MVAQTQFSKTHRRVTTAAVPTHEAVSIGPNRTIHIPLAAFVGKVMPYCIDWRRDEPRHDAAYMEDWHALRAVRALDSYRFCQDAKAGQPLIVRGADGRGDWQVAKVLRTDGLWEVVAVRVAGGQCESSVFFPGEVDFAVWVAHLS